MGGESHDPTHVVHSSIALLQERFRQLQRVKEMREERELLRILSEPNNDNIITKQHLNNVLNNPTMNHEPSSRLFIISDHHHHHHHLTFPQRSISPSCSTPQGSLSLWPTLQTYCSSSFEDQYVDQTPLVMKLWPLDTLEASSSDKSRSLDSDPDEYYSDVDTSLHL